MLYLYNKSTCPYSLRILRANMVIKAPLEILDVNKDPAIKAELIARGGKYQVPFLVDTQRGVSMYESLDIIEYLKQHYANGIDVPVEEVGNVCPID